MHELGLAALACSVRLLLNAAHRTAVHMAHSSETLHSKLGSPSLTLAQAMPDLGSHAEMQALQSQNPANCQQQHSGGEHITQAHVRSLFALVIAAHCQDDMAAGLSNLQARLVADARVAACSREAPAICHLTFCS